MECRCLALDGLVGEAREHVFERVLAGVGETEANLHGLVAHGEGAGIDGSGLKGQLGRLGGHTLQDDAGGVTLGVGEGDGACVAAGGGGGVAHGHAHLGACGEAALHVIGTGEVGRAAADVIVIETCSVVRAAERAEALVVHLDFDCLGLAYEQRAEVDDLGHHHLGFVAAHDVCHGHCDVVAGGLVGGEVEVEGIGAVHYMCAVGAYLHGLGLALAHGTGGGVENHYLAPVGVGRAGGNGPCHAVGHTLVGAAAQGCRELRPCLAAVVTHVAVVGNALGGGGGHA